MNIVAVLVSDYRIVHSQDAEDYSLNTNCV